jgi:hypothetical protein
VAPSLETLGELIRSCGFDLPLELVPFDRSADRRLTRNAMLSPEGRLRRLLTAVKGTGFDPRGVLATLDRHRVAYIVIGAFARIVQGAEETTHGVDIAPSSKPENVAALGAALRDLDERQRLTLDADEPIELTTERGVVKVVPVPAGTSGYDDLRRAATRESLGRGIRPAVASIDDLARMLAALGRDADRAKLRALRRLSELKATL